MYSNRHIIQVSYPIFLGLLAQNIINVTDTAFLGHVGEVELGASAILFSNVHVNLKIPGHTTVRPELNLDPGIFPRRFKFFLTHFFSLQGESPSRQSINASSFSLYHHHGHMYKSFSTRLS